jgi:hypothetical protein
MGMNGVMAQTITESIEKKVRFQDTGFTGNSLNVYNIHGDVTIEGYDGDEIRISARKQVDARRNKDAERGSEEVQLVIEESEDLVLVYVTAPFVKIKRLDRGISYSINRTGGEYDFHISITIQVPNRTNIHASTINNGVLTLRNVDASHLTASNVNGDVIMEQVAGTTNAKTVNGRIHANYSRCPEQNSEYNTVNGSIEVEFPADLSAIIRFQSLHGDLYTDFENIVHLSNLTATREEQTRGGTRWVIDKTVPLRIGEGGPEFLFRVLNGDVYLKRIKS